MTFAIKVYEANWLLFINKGSLESESESLYCPFCIQVINILYTKKEKKVMDEYLKGLGTTFGQDFVVIKWPPWMEEECLHAQTSQDCIVSLIDNLMTRFML